MDDTFVDVTDPAWFLAYSLDERLHGAQPSAEPDPVLGRLRFKIWRDEHQADDQPELFWEYLHRRGLDERALTRLLGESPQDVRDRFGGEPPAYVRRLADAWSAYEWPAPAAAAHHHGFATIAAPLLRQSRDRMRTRISAFAGPHPLLPVEMLIDRLGEGPVQAVNQLAARTLVLEMNVLRLRGELPGADPHERFHAFLALLHDPRYVLGILREYPVLARDLVRTVATWEATRIEFAERLLADLPDLTARCGALDGLAEVAFGAGDSHRGGRSVAIVRFDNGTRVMYKPRRLQVDRHLQDLLRWLNERGDHPSLRPLWVLDRADYGWTEFVSVGGCGDRAALGRFYRRQGALLGLLHTLGAIDVHLENVVAAGEDPVLVDLEALFHGWRLRLPSATPELPLMGDAVDLMNSSVISVGLLPAPVVWTENDTVNQTDLSGMAGGGGLLSRDPVATWAGTGTDEMRLVRERMRMPDAANLPSLDDQTPAIAEFRDDIVEGYRSMYRTLQQARDRLRAADGPLAAFSRDETRIVIRPTLAYAKMLQEGQHPNLLRDGLDRDRFYDRLWSGHTDRDHRDQLIAAELAQIRLGDVPIFLTTPSSTALTAGDGSVIADLLPEHGLAVVHKRLAQLSDAHLAQQTWFIEASITALTMGDPSSWVPVGVRVAAPLVAQPASAARFEAAARRIGDRLLDIAIVEDERIGWLGLSLVANRAWSLGPAGIDLYSGIAGIGLFFGYLSRVTGEPTYRDATERVSLMLIRQAEAIRAATAAELNIGVFGPVGGTVYALSHLAFLLDREDLARTAETLVPLMVDRIGADRDVDVIGGAAGGILAVLSLHAIRPLPALLEAAHRMAEHLLSRAEVAHGGLGWTSSVNPTPLAGFSHGASGIATALARLDRCTGRGVFRDTVRAALRFERALRDPASGNWRDDRVDIEGDMVAWCHGAGGVGLARADLVDYLDDHQVRTDLRQAVAVLSGAAPRWLFNHSICHGDLGNAECLLVAANVCGTPEAADRARVMAATALREIEDGGWRCGVPQGVETPGLMSGISGIGYALLRFATPDEVPSVLLLEPPH